MSCFWDNFLGQLVVRHAPFLSRVKWQNQLTLGTCIGDTIFSTKIAYDALILFITLSFVSYVLLGNVKS